MLFDLNTHRPEQTTFDFCIVGAGPAGITLALKLAQAKFSVLLVEGGGLDYSEASQSLYECESIGYEAWVKQMRLRYFGGTSNHWAGRCRPFEAADFEPRQIAGLPGWPIRYGEIEPYLEEAMSILDLNNDFKAINQDTLGNRFDPDRFSLSPPTRFKAKYLDIIKQHQYIHCFYNANAVDLLFNDNLKNAERIILKNYQGNDYSFFAGNFMLCMGAIENARFLLNANTQIPQGIGNQTDMVGRCFMEHLNVPIGEFIYRDPETHSKMQFFTSNAFVDSDDIGRGNITFSILQQIKSYGRTREIKTFFKNLACQAGIAEKVQFISEFKCPGSGRISSLIEQTPNKESRVTLSNETDTLGMKKAIFNWQINDHDRQTVRTISRQIAKSFVEADIGAVKLNDFILNDSADIEFQQHAHHMGTTRMASNHQYGVVDENLKVFTTDNLYIASSSIFSTGGACNPTMPIIQFCLRLADHFI